MEIIWTETGLTTLEEVSDFIAKGSPVNAHRFIREIYDKVSLLSATPRIGTVPHEMENSEVLQILHGNYRIVYKISGNSVSIIAVTHGSRDFNRLRDDLEI